MGRGTWVIAAVLVAGCGDKDPPTPKAQPPTAAIEGDGCAGYIKLTTRCSGEEYDSESEAITMCSQLLASRPADDPAARSLRDMVVCARGDAVTCEEFGKCVEKTNPPR